MARSYFCAAVGNVTEGEEMIRDYIANQSSEGKDDTFKIDEWVQSNLVCFSVGSLRRLES